MTFIDTSAIYALSDRADPNHPSAERIFKNLLEAGEELLTHNYVILESFALLHRRLGTVAALKFADSCGSFSIRWVDRAIHDRAISDLRRHKRRDLSLVDEISFAVMRSQSVRKAFVFDADFETAGFDLLSV